MSPLGSINSCFISKYRPAQASRKITSDSRLHTLLANRQDQMLQGTHAKHPVLPTGRSNLSPKSSQTNFIQPETQRRSSERNNLLMNWLNKAYSQTESWDYTCFPFRGATQLLLVPFPCNEIK